MAFTNQHLLLFLCFAIVLLLGLRATPTLARPLDNHHKALSMRERHELWMARYERVYKDLKEKERRFNIFKENVERIESFNANTSSNKSFKLGVNAFTDLTNEEFVATHTGYKKPQFQHSSYSSTTNGTNAIKYQGGLSGDELLDSLDWREKGAVTPVKDQGHCGSCWAFSAVGAVESLNYIKTGQLMPLSEKELLDCVTSNHGCNGGSMERAFDYIQQSQIGLVTEDEYPYQGNQGQCRFMSQTTNNNNGVKIKGYQVVIPKNDENALKQAVAQQPVSVTIYAGSFEFKHFQGDYIFNGECGTRLHAVVAIGYGTDTSGQDYWLLKNSYGQSWGDKGFMRIPRGSNFCNVAMEASYPL